MKNIKLYELIALLVAFMAIENIDRPYGLMKLLLFIMISLVISVWRT